MSIRVFLAIWMLLLYWPARAVELRFATGEFLSFDFSAEESSGEAKAPVPHGPFVDVVQAVCTHIRFDCPIDLVPWRRALAMVEQELADAVFAVIPNHERAADFLFTPALIDSSLDLYAHRSNPAKGWQPEPGGSRELHTLGPSGTANLVSLRLQGIATAHVHLEIDNLRLMRKLDAGRFGDGMVVMNRNIARRLIERHHLRNVREVGLFEEVGYAIAFSRQRVSPEKFQAFERGLEALIADGTISRILQRYRLELAPAVREWAARSASEEPCDCLLHGGLEEHGSDVHRGMPTYCPVVARQPRYGL